MAHEITLEKAAEMAHQAEFICRLIEVYPDEYEDGDVIAIASLLAKLTGGVRGWLGEEIARRVANHG
ncbi:hypothetical protein LNQ35_15880 [Yersinia ruckeri]|uniref:hypothetical protein n=1 Tax=Yersinia ruckeri TaxID=29486 RepID=UPI0020BD5C8E|nr:hypothetical protein [Yersinia ruckeri]EKN4773909.1 hypothetical protein [Yersinia enterocolitica]ELX2274148.1 hypothetical protein [Yersinia enterocolitica]MCK8543798.1 hypothetical protein [Yersinia ruckeri]MCK8553377.1 hypothetical protein [Yersinia ruckeri]MCW6518890.1 hypothetical protein [Yersinia ruckeri]